MEIAPAGRRAASEVEELSLNAWPALATWLFDGWVVRFAGGYTRRSNSVVPLGRGRRSLGEKVEECERRFAAARLPPNFKLSPAAEPPELDGWLAERGYLREAETSVMTRPIVPDPRPTAGETRFEERPTTGWLTAVAGMNGLPPAHASVHGQLMEAIVPEHVFVGREESGVFVACALGVLERGWLGIFDVVVRADRRRRGIGLGLMRDLLAWGAARGGRRAYLQVVEDNAPARALYAGLGFVDAYRYWYRRPPGPR